MSEPTDNIVPFNTETVVLTGEEVVFVQEMLNALKDLPGAWIRAEAYLIGRGVQNPAALLQQLGEKLF